jgi:hypothetical protein
MTVEVGGGGGWEARRSHLGRGGGGVVKPNSTRPSNNN